MTRLKTDTELVAEASAIARDATGVVLEKFCRDNDFDVLAPEEAFDYMTENHASTSTLRTLVSFMALYPVHAFIKLGSHVYIVHGPNLSSAVKLFDPGRSHD